MHELRLVAVSEDGSYAILDVPGRGGRFMLPIDDRLRTVARGQFSRLAQYEIEVESPLRPKEIQDRIRAGETADEIADAAGLPIERIRRFEGPVLAEREYRAQEAQRATVRSPGDSGPGPRLGDIVAERLAELGAAADDAQWDSRKRPDGNWQVQIAFTAGGRTQVAEWVFDPRRRHIAPDDDQAARLCLPADDLPATSPSLSTFPLAAHGPATATVTPIAPRLGGLAAHHPEQRAPAAPPIPAAVPGPSAQPGLPAVGGQGSREADAERDPAAVADERGDPARERSARERPARKAAGGRSRRASVPSWDEIMFGNSRQPD
jgi:Protein of unknown function (DUF3071)